ncbi:MAG: lytic transglycosylase domain-containing protein [Clostridia bacterium]|nr:lytic transglycosylase domain-containing protein [Clostridia bacterium]
MHGKFTVKLTITIAVILLVILLIKVTNVYNLIQKQIYKQEYSEYVNKYAQIYEIDPQWIYAIIKVESNFNPNVTSGSGAKGLMQLMDNTAIDLAKELGLEKFETNMLYDPETNIMLGVKYFDKLLTKYNENYYLAIAAYNAGIGNVDNWLNKGIISTDGSNIENIPYKETNMYVRKIVNAHKVYEQLYEQ